MRKIVFNCNQTKKQGLGHFFRCLNLAMHLKKEKSFNVSFAGTFSSFSLTLLKDQDFNIIQLTSNEGLFNFLEQFDYIITDRYDIDQTYINDLLDTQIKTIFIDDFNRLDFTAHDLIINFRIGIEHFNYKSNHVALGEKFFIYKPELIQIRNDYQFSESIKRILFFGTATNKSNDIFYHIPDFLIRNFHDIEIIHITNEPLGISSNRYKTTNYNNSIEQYFSKICAIINGGGLIKYEAAFCGIPSATLSTTMEQHEDTEILAQKGLLFNLGCQLNINSKDLEIQLIEFITNSKIRFKLNQSGLELFNPSSINNLIQKVYEL